MQIQGYTMKTTTRPTYWNKLNLELFDILKTHTLSLRQKIVIRKQFYKLHPNELTGHYSTDTRNKG